MTHTLTPEAAQKIREALDRGGFHATARGHVADALYISDALALLNASTGESSDDKYSGTERRDPNTETIPLHGKRYYQPPNGGRMKPCRRKGESSGRETVMGDAAETVNGETLQKPLPQAEPCSVRNDGVTHPSPASTGEKPGCPACNGNDTGDAPCAYPSECAQQVDRLTWEARQLVLAYKDVLQRGGSIKEFQLNVEGLEKALDAPCADERVAPPPTRQPDDCVNPHICYAPTHPNGTAICSVCKKDLNAKPVRESLQPVDWPHVRKQIQDFLINNEDEWGSKSRAMLASVSKLLGEAEPEREMGNQEGCCPFCGEEKIGDVTDMKAHLDFHCLKFKGKPPQQAKRPGERHCMMACVYGDASHCDKPQRTLSDILNTSDVEVEESK